MKTTRLIAGTLTGALLGLAPLAVVAPAHAKDNLTTTVELTTYDTEVIYGEEVSVRSTVTASDGGGVYKGTVTLYEMTSKNQTWVAVGTAQPGYSFPDFKPKSNSAYKAVYSGYTAATTYEDTLAPSESVAPLAIGVQRKVKISKKGLWLTGKVSPDFKRKKVVLKRIKGKSKTVKWRTVKTNKKGVFRVKAPNKRGFKFTVTVPGDNHFTGWTDAYQVY